MPFELNANVQITRDTQGHARQLSHPRQLYQPEAAGLEAPADVSPRTLADAYLREVSPVLNLPQNATANFAGELETVTPGKGDIELRFQEQKKVANMAVVTYAQSRFGIPVWNAGVSVRVRSGPDDTAGGVTGLQNEFHYDLELSPAPAETPYAPENINAGSFSELFSPEGLPGKPRINKTRLWIYRYETDERTLPQSEEENAAFAETAPSPDLPALPATIENGRHYVATEVLFTMTFPEWGELNWRAMVEVQTGAVLYIRALVACATGRVFLSDPATLGGDDISAHSAEDDLNALLSEVDLEVTPAAGNDDQKLNGEFVEIRDWQAPAGAPPTEPEPFEFHYSAKTQKCAAVSAYHNCDSVFRLIQSFGVDLAEYFDGTDFPVPVDHHAKEGAVNADAPGNEDGDGSGGFRFGVAAPGTGVGISVDLRVVLHEFGHAMLWDHVGSPNFGFAHSPGDSLAAILHDAESQVTDRFATFPFMTQSVGIDRRHDRSTSDGWAWGGTRDNRQYGSEQILSTTLFRVYQACGGDHADVAQQQRTARYLASLIVRAVGLLSNTTTDPEVYVNALIDTDFGTTLFEEIPGGLFAKVIRWSFEQQGLYQPAGAATPVTQPGSPPAVDVYIDDGRDGAYMPFSADYTHATSLWNRTDSDDEEENQAPVAGDESFLYVKVKNRGTAAAEGLVVRAYQTDSAGPETWPAGWTAFSAEWQSDDPLDSGAEVIAGPLAWTPSQENPRVLVSVSANGDPSNAEFVSGSAQLFRLVLTDNNVAVRDFD